MTSLKHLLGTLMSLALTTGLGGATPAGKTQQLTSPDQVPQGLAKTEWTSIRAAYEAGRHAFQPTAGGWQARNPGQQWTTRFDGRGFVSEPKGGGWQWGLELQRYGFSGAERDISGAAKVAADGQRLTYGWDATVSEWFVNDTRGLEHGFTVKERPPQTAAINNQPSTLNFSLAVRGSLVARVTADAQGVLFCDDSGTTVVNYSGLKVWDADGKILPSRFETALPERGVHAASMSAGDPTLKRSEDRAPQNLRLLVDDTGARYPLTIDPIAQQAFVKAGYAVGANDGFGNSVAVDGDTVVVGSPFEDSSTMGVNSRPDENAVDSGAAYVFVRSGTNWSQQAYLKASNTGSSDRFGYSVSVSGDTVVVGAYLEDSSTTGVNSTSNESATDSGAAYVFVRNGTNWSQQAYLKTSNTGGGDGFGSSVCVSGDTVAVGAYGEDSSTTGVNSTPNEGASGSGAAYVFVRSGTNWSQQAYLKANNTGVADLFGSSVSVDGDTVVVGAYWEDSSTTGVNGTPNESAMDSGAAYVFVRSGTDWSQQAYLKPNNTGFADFFGNSVSVSGDTVVVGAYQEDNSGAAYVFVRSGTNWTQQAYLKASNTGVDDRFGVSVAVSGDTVVVGAYLENSSTTGVNGASNESALDSGAAYVFVRSGVNWSQQAFLKASNTGTDDWFGISVSVSGDTVVVGATREDSNTTGVNSVPNNNAFDSGAAYVFVQSAGVWSQQAYAKPNNTTDTAVGDNLGYSVAVDGDTVVIGAPFEDSSSTGLNGVANENATDAGAAYVFVRNGSTWSQQAYLKASNTESADFFGVAVAIDGDTVVVGAEGEDSSSSGVNSSPNNSSSAAGAAYVFVRNGNIWTQQAYLKAGNPDTVDHFGTAVAISSNTVIVGAYREDSPTTGVNSTPTEGAQDSGAAYVFVRDGTNWSQQAYLKPSNTGAFDYFGFSVSASGDTAVVGAYFEDSSTSGVNTAPNNSAADSGAAYVFVRNGTNWVQQAYLKAGFSGAGEWFGHAVSVSGNTIAVGAHAEDSTTAGVNSTPNNSGIRVGAAYVFVQNGTNWSQQAYLKASNPAIYDNFGVSVAVSGDLIAVGALTEDSDTIGVNSTPNEGAADSGAVYAFTRNGTNWQQQAYIKASNTGVNDQFGHRVAVSGETIVVGAPYEDSLAAGVNPGWNESATDSGAAYMFLFATEIAVEQPAGFNLVDGTASLGYSALVGATNNFTFTIKNVGDANLTGLGITVDGPDAAEFVITASPLAPVNPSGSTTFIVQFAPTNTGVRTAALHIANNDTDENPFDIALTGVGLNPFALTGLTKLGTSLQFGITNGTGLPFTVLATTNVTWPLNLWSNLGPAVETPPASGQFQFTDPQATSHMLRFYRVRSP